jgi:hypothetical protein
VRPNDIRVESWCDLCERLYENSWQQDLLRFRSNFAFRGLSDKAYRLTNSFTRRCGSYAHLEYHLLRNFCKYAEVPWTGDNASDWRWLSVWDCRSLLWIKLLFELLKALKLEY